MADATKAPSATQLAPAQMRPAELARAINDKVAQMVSAARKRTTQGGTLTKGD